jgi:hypothetical protein
MSDGIDPGVSTGWMRFFGLYTEFLPFWKKGKGNLVNPVNPVKLLINPV